MVDLTAAQNMAKGPKAKLCDFFGILFGGQEGYVDIRLRRRKADIKAHGSQRPDDTLLRGMGWPNFPESESFFNPSYIPDDREAYFGIALRANEHDGRKKNNCLQTHALWADIDLSDHPKFTRGETDLTDVPEEQLRAYKAELFDHIMTVCIELDLPPRCVVDSGHGLHVYWARHFSTSPEDTTKMTLKLAHLFNGDTGPCHPAGTLRLPYSINVKNNKRPLLVEPIFVEPEAFVEDAAVMKLPDPPPKEKKEPSKPKPVKKEGQYNHASTQEKYAQDALKEECLRVSNCDYHRNHQLNKSAFSMGTLVGAGVLDEDLARSELAFAAEACGLGEEDPAEIPNTISSGLNAGKQSPRDMSHVGLRDEEPVSMDDIQAKAPAEAKQTKKEKKSGDSEEKEKISLRELFMLVRGRFVKAGFYRYDEHKESWWLYNNGVYDSVSDKIVSMRIYGALTAFSYYITRSQNTNVREHLECHLAKGDMDEQHDYELNCANGILDMNDFSFREHTPEWFSTSQSAAAYVEGATSDDWDKFIKTAVPNEQDRKLLQQYAGLCLTGETKAQKSLMLIGQGGNGKGVFMLVLQHLLGTFATSENIEDLKDGSFEMISMVGKRLCIASEIPKSFSWSSYKKITGEDTVSISVKFKTGFKTKIKAKIIMLANEMPLLGEESTNNSITRRIIPIDFNVTPAEVDTSLGQRLTTPENLSGILNWALQGLKELRLNNFIFQERDDNEARQALIEESNRVITFIKDVCIPDKEVQVSGGDLYASYRNWATNNGYKPVANNKFSKQLEAAARNLRFEIERTRSRSGVTYKGLGLRGGQVYYS